MNSRRPSFADLEQRDRERQQAQDLRDAQAAARQRSVDIADEKLAGWDARQRAAAGEERSGPERRARKVEEFLLRTSERAEREERAFQAWNTAMHQNPDPAQLDLFVDLARDRLARKKAVRRHPARILRRGRPLD